MSEKDCRVTISACHGAWRTIISLADAMTLAQNIIGKLKETVGSAILAVSLQSAAPLQTWLEQSEVREQLLVCTDPLNNCPLSAAKTICESLVAIQKKTFIETAVGYVLGDLSELATIKSATAALQGKVTAIKDAAKSKLAVINNEKIRWRDTQFARTSNLNALKTLYGLATGTESTSTGVAKLVDNVAGNFGTSTQNTAKAVTSLWGLGKRRLLPTLLTSSQSHSDIQVTTDVPTASSAPMNFDDSFP